MKNCDFYNELRALFKKAYDDKMTEYQTMKEKLKADSCTCGDFDKIKSNIDRYHEIEDCEKQLTECYLNLWINDTNVAFFKEFMLLISGEDQFESFHTCLSDGSW